MTYRAPWKRSIKQLGLELINTKIARGIYRFHAYCQHSIDQHTPILLHHGVGVDWRSHPHSTKKENMN